MNNCDDCGNGMNPRTRIILLVVVVGMLLLSTIPIIHFTLPALSGALRIQVPRLDVTPILFDLPAETPLVLRLDTQITPQSTLLPGATVLPSVPPVNMDQTTSATAVLSLVNAARTQHGLGLLELEPRLMEAALLHSQNQAEQDEMSHDGSDGSQPHERVRRANYDYCMTGENVAMRFDINPSGVFDQWWNSPPHQENMMTPDFTDIGIGYVMSANGSVYYTMILGKQC